MGIQLPIMDGYDHSENQPRCDRFQSSPSPPTRWMGKNRPREQQDVTAICRSLTAGGNHWRKIHQCMPL